MITAISNTTRRSITRNSSFYKRIPSRKNAEGEYDNDSDVADISDDYTEQSDGLNEINFDDEISQEGDNNDTTQQTIPRRNPARERNRPAYLQDDIQNLLDATS